MTMKSVFSTVVLAMLAGSALAAGEGVAISSHSDAPLIKQDPQANLTDVYAFVGTRYDDPSDRVLNVVVSVRPFSEPGDGPHYDRFADDARYSIHITDPATGEERMRYDFQFSAVDMGHKNLDTILSYGLGTEPGAIKTIGDARQNFTQAYSITKSTDRKSAVIGKGLLVAPPNVGNNVTPLYNDKDGRAVSGAVDLATLDSYTRQAISPLASGEVSFAGPREDSFYADIPGVFDLLNVRILDNNNDLDDGLGQDGGGVDGFKGFNVLSFALQIPIDELPAGKFDSVFFGPQEGVGVYASVSRRRVRVLGAASGTRNLGPWVQINRLGNPLFNEGLVALRDKDDYNMVSPTGDARFATYASNPELARLINFVHNTQIVESGRADLENIFIPDVLRVNTTTDPVRLDDDPNFSRLGFLGGDTTNGISSGWPNGRRFGDDVVDIALTAIASGPSFDVIIAVGDNVEANDALFNLVFPYAGTPNSGAFNRKDP